MKRRQFIATLCGAAATGWPMIAGAQARALPSIGWIAGAPALADISGPDPANLPARAFLHELRDLGWVESRSIWIERRSAEGRPERAHEIFAEFIGRGVDLIFAGAVDWVIEAAHKATRTVPIVALFNSDPVALGLVQSLSRPGGNLTGLTTTTGRELYEKRLQLFKELVPKVGRIAFLGTGAAWEGYQRGTDSAAMPIIFARVEHSEDFDQAFAILLRERVDGLVVSHGPVLFNNATRIIAFAAEHRLPAAYPWREASEAGGLMSYGSSAQALFRQAARYVDRILKGAKPAELPIEQPTSFELVINLKVTKMLGLEVPPVLLARAEDLID